MACLQLLQTSPKTAHTRSGTLITCKKRKLPMTTTAISHKFPQYTKEVEAPGSIKLKRHRDHHRRLAKNSVGERLKRQEGGQALTWS